MFSLHSYTLRGISDRGETTSSNRRYSFTPMMNPNYMQIAGAYGIPSRRVMERGDLGDAIQVMLATDGPFLLEVCVVEEGNVLPMTPPGSSVNYMLMEC